LAGLIKTTEEWANTFVSTPYEVNVASLNPGSELLTQSKINTSTVCAGWVVPENIHMYTIGGISEFRRGGGVTSTGIPRTWGAHWTGILKAWGGSLDWNSEGMGEFSGQ